MLLFKSCDPIFLSLKDETDEKDEAFKMKLTRLKKITMKMMMNEKNSKINFYHCIIYFLFFLFGCLFGKFL
jgi:hypothetical protein